MFMLYKQTSPPTTVLHSLQCHFTDTKSQQLITSSGTHMRVYRTNPYLLERTNDSNDDEWLQTTKLECIMSVQVLGWFPFILLFHYFLLHISAPIRSMASARIPGGQLDCLFLAFDDAKLSVVAYDRKSHDIVTGLCLNSLFHFYFLYLLQYRYTRSKSRYYVVDLHDNYKNRWYVFVYSLSFRFSTYFNNT
jgi:hypothetical protein